MASSVVSGPGVILKTRTGALIAEARTGPVGRGIIAMEAVVGWPYFVLRGQQKQRLVISIPFGAAWKAAVGRTLLFVPAHVVQLDWETGQVVHYFRPEFEGLWSERVLAAPVGTYPHDQIKHLTISQYLDLRTKAYIGYDAVATAMTSGGNMAEDELNQFRQTLRVVMEPGLEVFYRKLAPKFFHRFLPYIESKSAE